MIWRPERRVPGKCRASSEVGWRLLQGVEAAPGAEDPALNVALDEAIGLSVAQGGAPPTVRLWKGAGAFVLGRQDMRLPRLREAAAWVRTQGYVPVVRVTGGTAVAHCPGCAHFSVIAPRAAAPADLHDTYQRFCEGAGLGLRRLGLSAEFAHVPGAFCPGSRDLAVGGRKIAGIAQARVRGFVIVHGTLFVGCDLAAKLQVIEEFYRRAGAPAAFEVTSLVTVSEALGRTADPDAVLAEVSEGYRSAMRLDVGKVTEGERGAIRALSRQSTVSGQ